MTLVAGESGGRVQDTLLSRETEADVLWWGLCVSLAGHKWVTQGRSQVGNARQVAALGNGGSHM